jgi:hypothetical protein
LAHFFGKSFRADPWGNKFKNEMRNRSMRMAVIAVFAVAMLASAVQAQAPTVTLTNGSQPVPFSCNTYPNYNNELFCFNLTLLDASGTVQGTLTFYAYVKSDGTFNGVINEYNNGGALVFSSNDWAGNNGTGRFDGTFTGPFSVKLPSGTIITGTLTETVIAIKHQEGGGRVGIRTVTSYYVQGGTLSYTE